MSRIESPKKIEALVCAKRHPTDHLGRAVSVEQRLYALPSNECIARGIDLRECEYSTALDLGVDLGIRDGHQDVVVKLLFDDEYFDLTPAPTESPNFVSALDH